MASCRYGVLQTGRAADMAAGCRCCAAGAACCASARPHPERLRPAARRPVPRRPVPRCCPALHLRSLCAAASAAASISWSTQRQRHRARARALAHALVSIQAMLLTLSRSRRALSRIVRAARSSSTIFFCTHDGPIRAIQNARCSCAKRHATCAAAAPASRSPQRHRREARPWPPSPARPARCLGAPSPCNHEAIDSEVRAY